MGRSHTVKTTNQQKLHIIYRYRIRLVNTQSITVSVEIYTLTSNRDVKCVVTTSKDGKLVYRDEGLEAQAEASHQSKQFLP